MILRFAFALCVTLSSASKADMASAHAQGIAQAKSMPQVLPQNLNPQNMIPDFQGVPEEANLFTDSPHEAEKIRSAAEERARTSEAAQTIYESEQRAQRFTFDPKTDPLFTNAKTAFKDPMKAVAGEPVQTYEAVTEQLYENKTCQESGAPTTKACHATLHIRVAPQKTPVHRVTVTSQRYQGESGAAPWVISEHLRPYYEASLKNDAMHMLPYATHYFPISLVLTSNGVVDINHPVYDSHSGTWHQHSRADLRTSNPFPSHWLTHILKVVYLSDNPFELYHQSQSFGGGLFKEWPYLPEMYGKTEDYGFYGKNQFVFDVHYKDPAWPRPEDITETFVNDCGRLERKADDGLCSVVQEDCLEGEGTRIIGGMSFTRPCWKKKITYACYTPSLNNCGPLRAKGCVQIDSSCSKYVGSACVVFHQTYRCPAGTRQIIRPASSGNTPYCLAGDCTTPEYHPNDEMMDAISKLEIFRKIQDDVRAGFFEIFKGNDNRCSRLVMGIRDCCGGHNGWGVSMGLTKCDKLEKELAVKRQKNLCVQVGTYCSDKVAGVCVKKKTSFCCFTSKLAKLINEQGRAQLAISWGEPKNPMCRGLTPEEISRIDFSRLDLSELFEEIMSRFKAGKIPDVKDMVANSTRIVERVKERMHHVQQDIADHKKKEL
ncbi:MAG: hypothetical protein C0514_08085 [Candidatus Puniceispirillum sp.]|nr:hypothetical protein [Candidatus Puniceispirillum sp.]